MPSPRRRIPIPTHASNAPGQEEEKDEERDESRMVPLSKLRRLTIRKSSSSGTKRRNWLMFGLGGVVGIAMTAVVASRHHGITFDALPDLKTLESILDGIPAGVIKGAKDITQPERETVNYDSFAVGLHLRAQGIQARHPVIMIPGVISTGLESWGTDPPSRPYFRKRLWGSWSMMRALVLDKAGWKKHIMLDKATGLDPPGIKLRAAQGFDATDFFITGYWIWNKILENLASIGYDPSNAFTAAYDWRLSFINLERRDRYFTRLKYYIEMAVQSSQTKVVLVSHSMGSQVLFFFFQWVEADGYGNGGPSWVDDHVDSWINISGCLLGALKGLPSVLSGEMKDTAQLNAFAVYGLEKFLSREERVEIFQAMPGISSMLPKGGDAVWGNATWAPDDRPDQAFSFGTFLNFQARHASRSRPNLTMEESLGYLLGQSEGWYRDQIATSYSHGVARSRAAVEANGRDPRKWTNPLETRLPLAPHLKVYCFYGVGKATERSYFYREEEPGDGRRRVNVSIDTAVSREGVVDHGIVLGEGDGTVSLLSMGYMCAKGWRIPRYNPAGVAVTVYEMRHEPERFAARGGPNTGDHVDILGRSSLHDLILRIAGGQGERIEEHVESRIREYAERVQISEDDG